MDWIVQKAVELGVQRIVPVECPAASPVWAQTTPKTGALAADCGRGGRAVQARHTAAGSAGEPFRQALQDMAGQTVIVFYEGGGRPLRTLADAGMREAALVIGPGGRYR